MKTEPESHSHLTEQCHIPPDGMSHIPPDGMSVRTDDIDLPYPVIFSYQSLNPSPYLVILALGDHMAPWGAFSRDSSSEKNPHPPSGPQPTTSAQIRNQTKLSQSTLYIYPYRYIYISVTLATAQLSVQWARRAKTNTTEEAGTPIIQWSTGDCKFAMTHPNKVFKHKCWFWPDINTLHLGLLLHQNIAVSKKEKMNITKGQSRPWYTKYACKVSNISHFSAIISFS